MIDDGDNFKLKTKEKCFSCFRKDVCIHFTERHARIKICSGPFKDEEDRARKEKEAKLVGAASMNIYRRNIKALNGEAEVRGKKSKGKRHADDWPSQLMLDGQVSVPNKRRRKKNPSDCEKIASGNVQRVSLLDMCNHQQRRY